MKQRWVYAIVTGMAILVLAAGCGLPGMQPQAGTAIGEPAGRAVTAAQHPAVYEVMISRKDGNSSSYPDHPDVVWTGQEYGVAWTDDRDSSREIYFTRFNKNGVKIAGNTRITANDGYASFEPKLVWTGSEYGIAWVDGRDTAINIYFARINAQGVKIGGDVKISTSDGYHSANPSVAWSGKEYAVVWDDGRSGHNEIYLALVSNSGVKERQISKKDKYQSSFPSLVWSGSRYGVAWEDNRDGHNEIYFIMVNSDGSPSGTEKRISEKNSSESRYPSLAWTGSRYGVSWMEFSSSEADVLFSLIDADGSKSGGDRKIASGAAAGAGCLSSTWTGSDFGVAWTAYRKGNIVGVTFARVLASGSKSGGDVMVTANNDYDCWNPSLAGTGDAYGVAWQDNRDDGHAVYFARLDATGKLLPRGGLAGDLKGTQPGYYYIRNAKYGTYLTWEGTGVSLKPYNQYWPASQQWRLADDNADGSFQLMNCGSASSVSPYLSGQYVNNNLSQVLAVSWGQPTDADRLKSWWLYYQESRDMYLLRIQENTSYRVYATFDDTAKLKKSTRDYYKHWDLIPAGE